MPFKSSTEFFFNDLIGPQKQIWSAFGNKRFQAWSRRTVNRKKYAPLPKTSYLE